MQTLNYRNSLVTSLPLLNSFINSTVEFPFHRHLKKSACSPVLLILYCSVWSGQYWGSCLWFMYYMFFKKLSSFRAKGDYKILVTYLPIFETREWVFSRKIIIVLIISFLRSLSTIKITPVTLFYLLFSCNIIMFISYICIYIIVSIIFMIVLIHKNEFMAQKLFSKV